MGRVGISVLQRLRTRPRLRPQLTVLVSMLVFSLVAAPAWSALRNECDLCPRTCPMHQHGGGTAPTPATPHDHCHGSMHHSSSREASDATKVTRPPCGNHGVMAATILPPVILTAAPLQHVVLVGGEIPNSGTGTSGRRSDPPDTPPPIAAA